ncbi:hypothetical protein AWB72_02515 [Caballeronia concitans]|uniref:Uncharacterized protein n=1 Tax=Caballeronia concitans TaxID=1777133 RepID=A0A658QX45_9BURK|nr:hypothetical protein BurMR1_4805 [Burkholderia sp. MR1]SAL30054.1 hypothetical protein AWB72_02515 [Caballeronia concitans]
MRPLAHKEATDESAIWEGKRQIRFVDGNMRVL